MVVRMFTFRVPKKNERKMLAFMKREPGRLLRRLPAVRAAYFGRNQRRKNEYVWVTVWTNEAARRRTIARPEWKALYQRELAGGFFAGRPRAIHYDTLLAL